MTETTDTAITSAECPECGRTVTTDEDNYATCYGTRETPHSKYNVIRPCGICGDPIQLAEICAECGEETDGNAFSTPWGKRYYR